jgi:hypothetical protein
MGLGGVRYQQMIVGDFRGPVPAGAQRFLTKGTVYRVYYLPASETFLSIESVWGRP